MINTQDQEALFKLIADYLEKDITCIAIGGTAMMFARYKTTTKDIDLVFETAADRDIFIAAIKRLGYKEQSLGIVYDQKRKASEGKPLMFTRGDERFDLFVETVFGYVLEFNQEDIMQRNDFLGEKELIVYILPPQDLILLKAITGRERDHEDIETILDVENDVDWKAVITKAIQQKKNNEWILIDLEATLQRLKKKYFIKQEIFEMIYAAQERK